MTTTAGSREDAEADADRASFVEAVIKQCQNEPGARQALRQALRKAYDDIPMTTHKWVIEAGAPVGAAGVSDDRARAYYTVAALIARIPARITIAQPPAPSRATGLFRNNLGATMAESVRVGTTTLRSAEAALAVLGKQSTNGMHLQLPGIVARVTDRPDAVDWVQLLTDLENWPQRRTSIARRWQQSFYYAQNQAALRAAAEAADADDQRGDSPTDAA